eukprot:gene2516-3259_t
MRASDLDVGVAESAAGTGRASQKPPAATSGQAKAQAMMHALSRPAAHVWGPSSHTASKPWAGTQPFALQYAMQQKAPHQLTIPKVAALPGNKGCFDCGRPAGASWEYFCVWIVLATTASWAPTSHVFDPSTWTPGRLTSEYSDPEYGNIAEVDVAETCNGNTKGANGVVSSTAQHAAVPLRPSIAKPEDGQVQAARASSSDDLLAFLAADHPPLQPIPQTDSLLDLEGTTFSPSTVLNVDKLWNLPSSDPILPPANGDDLFQFAPHSPQPIAPTTADAPAPMSFVLPDTSIFNALYF